MDAPEPSQTTFTSVSTQTSDIQRKYQVLLDKSTPFVTCRWIGTAVLLCFFFARILHAQGWYMVAYVLGIYLLTLFGYFLQPKVDPLNEAIENQMEEGTAGSLPIKQNEEFKPFVRRLPEFKFWHSATRAILISFVCIWFNIFDLPVLWPLLLTYWLVLFFLIMRGEIQHMIKYKYVPFTIGKVRYNTNAK
ncbi:retrieval of early ER protein Rer1 [Diaporthe sp. PMI_573]|nr:retrieval of early ER protein Rer1 [Diaporthaceae sp. PMI_573]